MDKYDSNIILENSDKNCETINNFQIEKSIYKNRKSCRLCNSENLHIFYNLEPTPQANHFVKQPTYQETIPLDICICDSCNHIQLVQILNETYQYSNYLYITSASKTMETHIFSTIDNILKDYGIRNHFI